MAFVRVAGADQQVFRLLRYTILTQKRFPHCRKDPPFEYILRNLFFNNLLNKKSIN
jgi:hypothetical protein